MKNKKPRIAVIGVGGMGVNHCRVIKKIATLCGVCDINLKRALEVATEYQTRAFSDIDELIKDAKPDGIVVAVNTQYHKYISKKVIRSGLPLLVEKPLTTNHKDAKEILELAKKHDIFLMVGMVERYNPTITKLKKDIEKNIFGKIFQIVALRIGISPPNMHPRSVDLDLAIHDVDLIKYLTGLLPNKVFNSGKKHLQDSRVDTCSLTLEFDAMIATIITNWVSPVKIRKLFLFGEKVSAEIDLLTQKIFYYSRIPIKAISNTNFYLSFQELGAYSKQINFMKSEPLKEELLVFVNHLKSGYRSEYCESSLDDLAIVNNSRSKNK